MSFVKYQTCIHVCIHKLSVSSTLEIHRQNFISTSVICCTPLLQGILSVSWAFPQGPCIDAKWVVTVMYYIPRRWYYSCHVPLRLVGGHFREEWGTGTKNVSVTVFFTRSLQRSHMSCDSDIFYPSQMVLVLSRPSIVTGWTFQRGIGNPGRMCPTHSGGGSAGCTWPCCTRR